MGRKAKEAAQKKIGEWTGSNVSKVAKEPRIAKTTTKRKPAEASTTTTTKTTGKTDENTDTSNENRSPLQTYSQSELNAMKNCSVRLETIQVLSPQQPQQQPEQQQQQNEMVLRKRPAPATKTAATVVAAPVAPVIVKEKQTDVKKIYDYSFDDDMNDAIPLETGEEDAMKDLFDKLAKENKIVVKKYRPKNVKKQKTTGNKEKPAKKATVTRKRPRENQATNVEQPPQKRPNLKNKKVINTNDVVVDKQIIGTEPTVAQNANKQIDSGNGISANKKVVILEDILINPKETLTTNKTAIHTNHVNVQQRLPNRLVKNFQSTPKSSTPLSTKTAAKAKGSDRLLNSSFFENVSPLNDNSTRSTRSNLLKQRLRLSAINDSDDAEASTSSAYNNAQEYDAPKNDAQENNAPIQPPMDFFDDDDGIDFADSVANEPQSNKITNLDKENTLDRPGPSTAIDPAQPSTSSAGLVQNRPRMGVLSAMNPPQASTSAASSNKSRFGTNALASSSRNSSAKSANSTGSTPRNANNYSNFEMNDTSDYMIFSPTKRVYGRSPLKNITSEVNNTNSPSFQMFKSPSALPRSFGALKKSTLNSTSVSTEGNITLPEASHFTSRRAADDFDRTVNDASLMDKYFGFDDDDDDDDDEIDNNNDTLIEQPKSMTSDSISTAKSEALNEIRARLKRFLHNPEAENVTIKRTKATDSDKSARKKAIKTPIKSPMKKSNRTPIKRNAVFSDTGAKQKDIRKAFTAKMQQNDKQAKAATNDDTIPLFEEVVPNQDRRRSYSRPQRQRKRRISIESEHSEDEEHSDDDDIDADGKSTKRAKRRKKMTERNPKEQEDLNEYARKMMDHFAEVDDFELVVE